MSRITTRTLDCGLPLIVETMSGVRSAALSWLIPAGAAYDPAHEQGRATMTSELLLRGAGDLNSRAFADAMDRLGAARSTESGAVMFRIGATMLGEKTLEVLGMAVEMVLRPRFDEDAIEPSRDLALQSLESLNDDPQERASLLLRSRHLRPPLDRSGLGTTEGLGAITRDSIVTGWKQQARPGGSVLAVAGAVDPDAIERLLNKALDGWTGSTPEPAPGNDPPRGYWHEEDDSSQVQILLAHDAPCEAHPDSVLERVAMNVLSGGMAGRLFTEVREKRALCYSVQAGYRADKDHGVVTAYVGTTPERAQESIDVLTAEMVKLHTPEGKVTADEFARAKVGMKAGLVFGGESTAARAGGLSADYRKLGRARSLEEIAAQIDAVTLDQLNAYLARRRMGTPTIQTLGPKALTPPSTVGW